MTFQRLLAVVCVITCTLQAHGADEYTDEKRPYEFGFTIDGEQHRHEKKDEKGLIMGEFGFITADGVYHVTVYATDEQGRFKILSMKNIRVKPYPSFKQSNGSARQGHSLDVGAPEQTITPQVSTTQKPLSIPSAARSCSHCSIPTTTTPAPVNPPISIQQPENASNNPFINNANAVFLPSQPNQPIDAGAKQIYPQSVTDVQTPQFEVRPEAPQPNVFQNQPQQPQTNNFNYPQQELSLPLEPQNEAPISGNNYPQVPPGVQPQVPPESLPQPESVPSGRTPKRLDDVVPPTYENQNTIVPKELPKKPVLIHAQMQIVDKNTDIYKKGPGERDGLPEGITKDDMSTLLYTFNYTVGFHGHFEEGYTSGVKQGYYYVTGRNGVRTRVDYVADSKGFRPKITQEVLDLLSEDVPKPETEKDAKYGLKGYEFKWLYFPVESKGRQT